MADSVITKQELIDAQKDAQTLEDAVNGEPGKLIKSRTGREFYSLASVPQINTMTREEVTAAVAPKANDAEVYKKTETFTKQETNALVAPKANQADVDNAISGMNSTLNTSLSNLSTTANKYYSTLAAANADIANIALNQSITIGEEANSGLWEKKTAGATSLTKSPYDPLTQAKAYADAYATVKAQPIVAGADLNTFTTSGKFTLSANLAVGQLSNWPVDNNGFHQAGTLVVHAVTTAGIKLATQIFYPYIDAYEVKIRANSGSNGAWGAWKTLSTYEKLATIFPKFTDLSANNSSLLSELAQLDFYGKSFADSEIVGTSTYAINTFYIGLNAVYNKAANFNKLKARIWNPTAGGVEYRVYTGSAVTSGVNGYNVSAANAGNFSYAGICKVFPISDDGVDSIIELDKIISIPKDAPFVIVFKHSAMATFRIGYHTALSGNLADRGFTLGAVSVPDWSSGFSATNKAVFIQAGFQLLLDVVSSSGSAVVEHIPDLVLPPKIYAIPTYDSNIYLEHLTLEDHTLYEYDITCSKGWHRKRGWWWKFGASEATAEYQLSISVHDKQTGVSLASASSVVKCTALSSNAGTKRVLAIGDSLLVSGDITQQLLDMSVADVMKVELIGTRGTGLNKHEGRGGWTINDYTTAGRTYYQFTVSGVTELPAINATTYTVGSSVLMVQEINISSGSGTILCNLVSGSAPSGSGTLTKSNAATGDSTIAFSSVTAASGNPFWNGSAVNFANYLSVNSLTAPDIVFIQLGVNDTFGLASDSAVETFTTTAFANLDTLINSIKAVNATIKVAVCAPPVYASQDAFGENYASGQTAWRAKRNIVTYNKKLYERYKDNEVNRIYVVGSGVNMDTLNNFPSTYRPVNAFNTDTVYMQTNAVHPAKSGYQQIGVSWFATAKAI